MNWMIVSIILTMLWIMTTIFLIVITKMGYRVLEDALKDERVSLVLYDGESRYKINYEPDLMAFSLRKGITGSVLMCYRKSIVEIYASFLRAGMKEKESDK